jgi:hypothetical protein
MWFAKLFGGRDEREDDEEPTAVAPHRAVAQMPTTSAVTKRPATAPVPGSEVAKRKGFDPYNSGSFERRNAWERVNRR